MKFTKSLSMFLIVAALLFLGFLSPPDVNAAPDAPVLVTATAPAPAPMLDTTYLASENTNGYSLIFNFTKDSTGNTVTDWFDFYSWSNKNVYFTHTFTDLDYGRSAGNDTTRCILQVQDVAGNILNSDTIGTGSEGSEKLISWGTTYQYVVSPKAYGPKARLVFINLVTGTHVNGRGHELGTLYMTPK
jgi:hypothetical protein